MRPFSDSIYDALYGISAFHDSSMALIDRDLSEHVTTSSKRLVNFLDEFAAE